MLQQYIEREVPDALTPLVRRLWWLRMPSPQRFELIVPIPAVHLIVNLSTPYRVVRQGSRLLDEEFAAAFLSGLQWDYLVNENPAEIHHVGAELAPWALPAFGVDPRTAARRVQDAEGPFPGAGAVRDGARVGPGGGEGALDALEGMLLARRDPAWRADHRIREAVEAIVERPDRPMNSLASATGLTPKGFAALFQRHCGMAPKRFAVLCRHHEFLQRLPRDGESARWTDLLAGGGYYDQPAFIREFRRFTGMTPTAYLGLRREYDGDDPSFLALGSAG